MSDGTLSDDVRALVAKGLSGSEAVWLARRRIRCAKRNERAARLARDYSFLRIHAFWMVLGVLILRVLGGITKEIATFISAASFGRTPNASLFSYASYTILLTVIGGVLLYVLAQGKCQSVADALSRRYVRRTILFRDLLVAIALTMAIRVIVGIYPISWESFVSVHSWGTGLFTLSMALLRGVPDAVMALALIRLFHPSHQGTSCNNSVEPFSAEAAIGAWRSQLQESESLSEEDIIELEEHLRDEMTALAGTGLSEQTAFEQARQRIGPKDAIDREYGKVNVLAVWRTRVYWMLSGCLLLLVLRIVENTVLPTLAVWTERSPVSSVLFGRAVLWILGYVLIAHLATYRIASMMKWFTHRHRRPRFVVLDLGIIVVFFFLISGTFGLAADWHVPVSLHLSPFSETMLVMCLLTNTPLLIACCVGILCLHPSMHRCNQI